MIAGTRIPFRFPVRTSSIACFVVMVPLRCWPTPLRVSIETEHHDRSPAVATSGGYSISVGEAFALPGHIRHT
jgi:hypothetical protein